MIIAASIYAVAGFYGALVTLTIISAVTWYQWEQRMKQRRHRPKGNEVTRELSKDAHKPTNGHHKKTGT